MGVVVYFIVVFCALFTFSASLPASVMVDGSQIMSKTNDDYICFTMDWWPPNKCDYGTCAWGNVSIINQDLDNPLLIKAIKAMSPVVLRLGGSLADHIVYNVGNPKNCDPMILDKNDRLGFDGGCFEMSRWDAINKFCNMESTGCQIMFGLNLLNGRKKAECNSTWCNYTGTWDSSNTKNFLEYTAKAGYSIKGWELGNELNGNEGVTAHLSAEEEANNFKTLDSLVKQFWPNEPRPVLAGPDGNFIDEWFKTFVQRNPGVSIITHHLYFLGAGVDPDLSQKIMNPMYLDKLKSIAAGVQSLKKTAPNVELWVGEAGGAYNSGHHLVTDAFISGFWYLDQIATFAFYGHKCYCRQSLIGGNYGLLNTTTLHPNPDYYSALLFRTLMGNGVLKATTDTTTPYLRAYAHCLRNGNGGITLLLLNLSPSNSYTIDLQIKGSSVGASSRLEYHLSAPNNDLHIQSVLLNGNLLEITPSGDIPPLEPKKVDPSSPLVMEALTYSFIVLPDAGVTVC